MKTKILSFVLLFMLGAGHLVYASSATASCGMMSPVSKTSSCCAKKSECQCKIKPAAKLYPQAVNEVPVKSSFSGVANFTVLNSVSFEDIFVLRESASKSPPGQAPLYALHSAYRI